jgi:hypothetical protein
MKWGKPRFMGRKPWWRWSNFGRGKLAIHAGDSFDRAQEIASLEENTFYSNKKTYGYREGDEPKRQAFIAELSTLLSDKIVYVDE